MIKKIATNTFSQILSKASTAIISIFLLSILTNYLSVELFGLYNKIYNYLGIFSFLADLWLYTIAIREITNHQEDSEKIVGNIMTLRLILGLIILIFSLVIGYFLPWYNSSLALFSIFIISLFTLFGLMNSSIMAVMQANMKVEFNFVSTTLWKIVNLLCIAWIAFFLFPKETTFHFDAPFLWIMWAGLLWIIVNTILNYLYASKICRIRFLFDRDYILHIFKISLPYGLALFLSVVYFKVDIILLSLFEPKEQANISIALYSLPMKIIEVLMVVVGFYLNSILPSLSRFFEKKETENAQKLLSFSAQFLFSLGLIIFILWILLRDTIILLVANKDYLSKTLHHYTSSDAFLIVLLVVLFYFVSSVFNYIFIASKHQSRLLKINSIVTIFNIVGNIIMIPRYSFIGSGIVTACSQIILFVLWYFYTRDIIRFKIDYINILKSVILAFLVLVAWYYLRGLAEISLFLDLLVRGAFLFWVYFIGIYFLIYHKKKSS